MAARPALCAGAVSSFVCSRFIPGLLSSAQVAGRRDSEERGEQQLLLHLNPPSLLPQPPSLHPPPLPPTPGEVFLELGFTDCRQREPARWLQLVFSAQSRKSDNNNDNYHLHN